MFSEDGKLVWAAQYRTWGAVHKIWQADNDNDIRGPYPPPIRGNLAFKYDTVEAQTAQTCTIRFQGQWEDAETGLYYNRYRYYDPLTAQYISPDPIGLAGGLRSSGYVDNPNAWIDPWGLTPKPFSVGPHKKMKGTLAGYDAHHIPQSVLMKKFVPGYDPKDALTILVPRSGHTITKPGVGIVSRSTKDFNSIQGVLTRDIAEMRIVYGKDSNSGMKNLIDSLKKNYPNTFDDF